MGCSVAGKEDGLDGMRFVQKAADRTGLKIRACTGPVKLREILLWSWLSCEGTWVTVTPSSGK